LKNCNKYIANCPQCLTSVRKRPRTRSNILFIEEEEVICIVRNMLCVFASETDIDKKKILAIDMFEYLYLNMSFVNKNQEFETTIRNKLTEFATLDNWDYAREIYFKMFNEHII
jgi:hypothetical protein